MDFSKPRYVKTNGIDMAVYEEGHGVPVVLCHGWPELAYSWRHQIPALADAGFQAIAPDQRGYGNTGGPKGKDAVPLYDMEHLTSDLVGLLDALDIERAVFCGHDWGGLVVWQMPLMHPDRVAGVIGVNTPFSPRLTGDPIEAMRAAYGEDMYIVFFQRFGEAEKVLEADTARSLRFLYRKGATTQEEWERRPPSEKNLALISALQAPEEMWPGIPLLSEDELDYYVGAFEKTGFEGGINWYRNFSHNWRMSEGLRQRIDVPCLMISAADDVVLPPRMADGMDKYIADLEKHVIAECGHWTQTEKPGELNRLMIDWLGRRFG